MSSRVGDLLIQKGLVDRTQLEQAELLASQNGGLLNAAVVKLGAISEQDLIKLLSDEYSLPIVDLEDEEVSPEAVQLVPHNIALKYMIIPLQQEGSVLQVAMVDPSNIAAINDLRFITGYDIGIKLAVEPQVRLFIEKFYEGDISYDDIFDDFDGQDVEVMSSEEDIDLNALEKATEDAPVVKLVNALLMDAIKKGASDIHLEPYEKSFRVRFRIDGVLYEIMKPPIKLKNAIISRLKIMAELDIAERRLPQDGRIKLKLGQKREMDFRVSVLPGLFGEKVVLRLLDKGNLQTDMTKLGFFPVQLERFTEAINRPYGMVLVTGPTGSGKTTTLYSALAELNKATVNISTAEDPVEFNLFGINQVQMHEEIGLNFAASLRSFLRQDPDIIMVGEIRDYETAEIAIKASLTGHLVLSTLHTNDAPSTINRLLNMGVEPFLVASSVNIVVAQRLARRICDKCKKELNVPPEALIGVGIPAAEVSHTAVYHGKGCGKCSNTGYKGRVALYECMTMTETLKEYVLNGASAAEIKRKAIDEGMISLRMSGLTYIKSGVTTIEEVLRVTAPD
ncbi:MAG TPA: type IV-A pilus assembly ATPase PilB [Oligoflexia bacterium]|nr:type IV-A pilus assembly ATPase PilB [Oligoflexia bacterium]HMP48919.1 type IV-A pilus assembly ATPase PilB [Oligoflexia bacterium]